MTTTAKDTVDPLLPASAVGAARIVLGGRFGEEPVSTSWRRLDRFVQAGGQLVDTAHSYASGQSERVIGEWLRANPRAVKVIDKIGHPNDAGRLDLSAPALKAEAVESRRRLGVEKIDVLMLHRDSPSTRVEEITETLVGLVQDGYVERIGVSNWPAERLRSLVGHVAELGHAPVVSYQQSLAVPKVPLWPGTHHADAAVRSIICHRGLTLLAWAAQARGFMAGQTELPGQEDPFDTHDNRARRQRSQVFAYELGLRAETIALAWLLHQPNTLPIIGPRSIEELDASLAAANVRLDPATMTWLAEGTR